MQLRLNYPPTPDNAARFAADMVGSAAEISGVELDYSVASLQAVDEIIEGFRRDGVSPDQIATTLFGFGCYVGEVFVRQARGKWRNTAETPLAGLVVFPLVVELGPDSFCNPIGKVFKRLERGAEESLPYFFQVFVQQ